MADDTISEMTLLWNEPLAVEVTAAVQQGRPDRVQRLIEKHPGLAQVWIIKEGEAAGWRTLLHLFADWPGHRRNPAEIVAVLHKAGADPEAAKDGGETPLHWAASNDDVELVDALLDAGADVNAPGSIIGGLGPVADAAVFGGLRAGLRLVERGAHTNIFQAAALGLTERVEAELVTEPGPDEERITQAFWAACRGGHHDIAELLLAEGADSNWVGWGDQTALDVARTAEASDLVEWLQEHGAHSGAEMG